MSRISPLADQRQFTALIVREDGWYIGCVEEVPGANAQERTESECLRSLKQAVRDILEIQREDLSEQAPRHRFREVTFSV